MNMALLDLQPTEFFFNLCSKRLEYRHLVLRNTSKKNVVTYKIRTNTPTDIFTVHPLMGVVKPNQAAVIHIYMNRDVPWIKRKRYELLVSATTITDSEVNLQRLWMHLNRNDTWMAKIECKFIDQEQEPWWLTYQNGGKISNMLNITDLDGKVKRLRLEVDMLRTQNKIFKVIICALALIIIIWAAVLHFRELLS
ncbi:uncharacterized protein LOC110175984 [Drosophila serrata]|uniref:uncharacterized protein LOC110175984 n=1 Tax=Drosophila serrata TaxID=7274 RepID=UPI000A1D2DB1|nr:uncharacterized protein LOC110175984 [Drosophila serrata]